VPSDQYLPILFVELITGTDFMNGGRMNSKEAKSLERRIYIDAPSLRVKLIRIGNGEWVCVVGSIWIWDEEDWEECKNHPDIRAKLLIA
jgi:hypothetical protein